jgi:hypothetical protein
MEPPRATVIMDAGCDRSRPYNEPSAVSRQPSETMMGHPVARRLDAGQSATVRHMLSTGISPREALTALRREDPKSSVVARTIYNERVKMRNEELNGRSPLQALLDTFKEEEYRYKYQCNNENQITHLFFAHPTSVQLTRRYPTVLLMDCTYKTNRYRMPLLHVVGMTSFNTTFTSCMVFLNEEKENDYIWALDCVAELFEGIDMPSVVTTDCERALMHALERSFTSSVNLLCVWHIQKNVLANCKQCFDSGEEWEAFLGKWTLVR